MWCVGSWCWILTIWFWEQVKLKQTGAKRMLLPSVEGQEGGNWIVIDSGKYFLPLVWKRLMSYLIFFALYGNILWVISNDLITLLRNRKGWRTLSNFQIKHNPNIIRSSCSFWPCVGWKCYITLWKVIPDWSKLTTKIRNIIKDDTWI